LGFEVSTVIAITADNKTTAPITPPGLRWMFFINWALSDMRIPRLK
jgi:hypothetical protein